MKGAVRNITLGEVCTLQRGFDLPKQLREAGPYPLVSSSGTIDTHKVSKVTGPGVVTGRSGSIGSVFYIEEEFWPLNTTLYVKDFHGNYPRYVYYLLQSFNLARFTSGTGVPTLNRNSVHSEDVLITTSLPEQRRIVAILDEAFAGIDQAVKNTEQNLASARELFESELNRVFSEGGERWEEKKLTDLVTHDCNLSYGIVQPGEETESGLPIVRPTDLTTEVVTLKGLKRIEPSRARAYSRTVLQGGDILLCVRGTTGTVAMAHAELAGANVTRGIVPIRFNASVLDQTFGFYAIRSEPVHRQIKAYTSGTALMQINIRELRKVTVPHPDPVTQGVVVESLKLLESRAIGLESLYQQKLAALAELKQSLLQKAFAGELTGEVQSVVSLPFPMKIEGVSCTEIHAGILALAHVVHEQTRHGDKFGRVKGEKISHFVESHLGIELEREPVKDAAGPNAYPHLKKVQSRAKKAGYYEFTEEQTMHRLNPGNRFDYLVDRTKQRLGVRLAEVEDLLRILAPLDTRAAEIAATVHAAWNNLLLRKEPVTDEAIVTEARENWHPAKLKIDRERFFKAIPWLREHGLVPQGRGKLVEAANAKPKGKSRK